ncbi:MAG: hypothetical protein AAFU64_20055 [Bacteroidota bacterium]
MNETSRLMNRLKDLRRQKSSLEIVGMGLDKISVFLQYPFQKSRFGSKSFQMGGKAYPYFVHPYNATWRNERGVEIALMADFLKKNAGKHMLEIGNVATYYGFDDHQVIDKYEVHPRAQNIDIMDFQPEKPFDALFAISTFEHVGWDESPKQPEKIKSALERLIQLVAHPDQVLITLPLGYNDYLDQMVADKTMPFQQEYFLKRTSKQNDWEECDRQEALRYPYGSSYPAANTLLVAYGLKA